LRNRSTRKAREENKAITAQIALKFPLHQTTCSKKHQVPPKMNIHDASVQETGRSNGPEAPMFWVSEALLSDCGTEEPPQIRAEIRQGTRAQERKRKAVMETESAAKKEQVQVDVLGWWSVEKGAAADKLHESLERKKRRKGKKLLKKKEGTKHN
jgi:hypothetical protein